MTTQEQIEVAMRMALQDIKKQCEFVIATSTNKDLVAFAKLIERKTNQ